MSAPTGLLFVDSFDHYNTQAAMQGKWTVANNPTFVTGRNGTGQAITCGNASSFSPQLTFGWTYPTITVGCAYRTNSFTNGIIQTVGGDSSPFNSACNLGHWGDGRIFVALPFGASTVPFPGFAMNLNTWYFFEMKVTFSNDPVTSFTYEVYVNGSLLASGYLSRGGSYTKVWITGMSLGSPGGGGECQYDDVYVTDGEVLGDTAWTPIYPNGTGAAADWTPHPTQANWINTSEHAPDGTTYNEGGTSGNQDLYNMDDIGSYAVVGAHALNYITKNASGVSSIEGSIKTNGTLVQEPEFFPSFGSYIYQRAGYRKNPITGANWTAAEINAIQRGALRIT